MSKILGAAKSHRSILLGKEQSPNDTFSLVLGIIYHQEGEYDEAIAEFKKTIVVDPNYLLGYDWLGLVYHD